jgi:hypothetical protein
LIDRLEGEAEIEKSGGCALVTTRVTFVLWVSVPLIPVMVNE